jgi:hypothetical protein
MTLDILKERERERESESESERGGERARISRGASRWTKLWVTRCEKAAVGMPLVGLRVISYHTWPASTGPCASLH